MNGKLLEQKLNEHELTYVQFADQLNQYCRRQVINPKRARQSVSEWINGTYKMHPALDFAIERFFQEQASADRP